MAGLVTLVGTLLILAQVFSANKDSFMTVSQMKKKGFKQGIPLAAHAGFWGDIVFVTPLCFYIVGNYGGSWDLFDVLKCFIFSSLITGAMACFWNRAAIKLPESMTYHGRATATGIFHAIYMVLSLTVFLLFFFSNITQDDAIFVSLILGIHVFCGTHIPLNIWKPDWYYTDFSKKVSAWVTVILIWSFLLWRCVII